MTTKPTQRRSAAAYDAATVAAQPQLPGATRAAAKAAAKVAAKAPPSPSTVLHDAFDALSLAPAPDQGWSPPAEYGGGWAAAQGGVPWRPDMGNTMSPPP